MVREESATKCASITTCPICKTAIMLPNAETSVYDEFLNMPGEIPITMFKNWKDNEYANPNGYYNPWYGNPYFTIQNNREVTNNDYLTGSLDMHIPPSPGLTWCRRPG